MTVFGAMSMIGWTGAFVFLLLFVLHPSTRKSRNSRASRLFWLFILADSAVMLMIYSLGVLNIFFHNWVYLNYVRLVVGVAAICVVWWRVLLFWGLNMRKRREEQLVEEEAQ